MELFWVDDGQGGFRVFAGDWKTRRVVDAHERAIADHLDVFRDLAE